MKDVMNSGIVVLLLLAAAIVIMPLYSQQRLYKQRQAASDGKIDDCVPMELDQVPDFTGTTHLVWNSPEDENGTMLTA